MENLLTFQVLDLSDLGVSASADGQENGCGMFGGTCSGQCGCGFMSGHCGTSTEVDT